MSINNTNILRAPALGVQHIKPLNLELLEERSPGRLDAENFVQKVFLQTYKAQITELYPSLFSIKQSDESFAAVVGMRAALSERLFLEQYLDHPIEEVISVPRDKIIEMGNLAPADVGQTRWLILTLNTFLEAAGFTHVVFTAVPQLRNSFQRMNLPLQEVANATTKHLTEKQKLAWGNYYSNKPIVCVGDLSQGNKFLLRYAKKHPLSENLFQQASLLGISYSQKLR